MVIVPMDTIINDPDKRDEIVALMAEINEINSSEEGIIIHDWYANLWEPNRIRMYIEHESLETLLAAEENPTPEWLEGTRKLLAFQQSGALTMEFENNLRRYEMGTELPPFAVQPG
jgi:quinol monooxygenase YgiN